MLDRERYLENLLARLEPEWRRHLADASQAKAHGDMPEFQLQRSKMGVVAKSLMVVVQEYLSVFGDLPVALRRPIEELLAALEKETNLRLPSRLKFADARQ